MINLNLNEFIDKCKNSYCPRKTIKSKKCYRENHQIKCYEKYLKKFKDKKYENEKWKKLIEEIWIDRVGFWNGKNNFGKGWTIYCQYYKSLNDNEKKIILEKYKDELNEYINTGLDCAHIESRTKNSDLYYDKNNIVLINHMFHLMLDNNRNPLTGKLISTEERKQIMYKIRDNG